MELKFDTSKTYALCLEGGGARGAYQIGAWQALCEAGVKITAAAGSSVGALNGALIAMENPDLAFNLWYNMRFSRVMDVDDAQMRKIMTGKLLDLNIKSAHGKLKRVLKDGGFDVTPLKNLIKDTLDCEKIRNSDIRLFICTHSITDHKGLEFEAKKLGDEELRDMLLASAYFPAFKHEEIGGKLYTDGGVSNVLPLSPLVSRGFKNIISIRLYGLGTQKRISIPKGTTVTEIAPKKDLGNMLNFDTEPCRKNLSLGYFDAKRLLYGLYGEKYYIDRTLSEEDAYKILFTVVKNKAETDASLRQIHTDLLKFAKESGAKGDYYDVLVAFIEKSAERLKINEFSIYTDAELLAKIGVKNGN
ncbi:MAG: patatin-like phospholipase family protein [Clostridia bacterium]|nr:patatin-like phospholipase family protein [Clostridia bacterium]